MPRHTIGRVSPRRKVREGDWLSGARRHRRLFKKGPRAAGLAEAGRVLFVYKADNKTFCLLLLPNPTAMDLTSVSDSAQLLLSPTRNTHKLLKQPRYNTRSVLSPATQLSQLVLKTPTKQTKRQSAIAKPPLVFSLPKEPSFPGRSPSARRIAMDPEAIANDSRSSRRTMNIGSRRNSTASFGTPKGRLLSTRARTEPRIHGRLEKHQHQPFTALFASGKSSRQLFGDQDAPPKTPTHVPTPAKILELGQENIRPKNSVDTTPRILFKELVSPLTGSSKAAVESARHHYRPRAPLGDVTVQYLTKNEVRREQDTTSEGKLIDTVKSIRTTVKVTTSTTVTSVTESSPTPQQGRLEELEEQEEQEEQEEEQDQSAASWQVWEDWSDDEEGMHTPRTIMAEDFEHDNQENIFIMPPNETPSYKRAKRHASDDVSTGVRTFLETRHRRPLNCSRSREPLHEIDVRNIPEYENFLDDEEDTKKPRNLARLYRSIIASPGGTLPTSLQDERSPQPNRISVNMLLSPSRKARGKASTKNLTRFSDEGESSSLSSSSARMNKIMPNGGNEDEDNVFLVRLPSSPSPAKFRAHELNAPSTQEGLAIICGEPVAIPQRQEWEFEIYEDPEGEATDDQTKLQDIDDKAMSRLVGPKFTTAASAAKGKQPLIDEDDRCEPLDQSWRPPRTPEKLSRGIAKHCLRFQKEEKEEMVVRQTVDEEDLRAFWESAEGRVPLEEEEEEEEEQEEQEGMSTVHISDGQDEANVGLVTPKKKRNRRVGRDRL